VIQTVTVDNTPRDINHIRSLPVSHRYKLAYTIGALSTEDAKMAFGAMEPEAQAQFTLDVLNEYDKKGNLTNMTQPQMPGQMTLPNTQQVPMPPGGIPGAPGMMPGMGQPMMPGMGAPQGVPMGAPQGMPMNMPGTAPQGMQMGGMPGQMPMAGAIPPGSMPGMMQMPGSMGAPQGIPQAAPAAAAPQAAPAGASAEALTKLAEAMQSMANAQAEMATQLGAMNGHLANLERLGVVDITCLVAYASAAQKAELPAMAQYFGQIIQGGMDQTVLAGLGLAGKG